MRKILCFLFLIFVFSCTNNNYLDVGDIPFDQKVDDIDFTICNENDIKQYYVRRSSDAPPSYKGEKRGMEGDILSKYSFPRTEQKGGYLTIRFIVNCKGETGRFRMEEMDFAYKPMKFDVKISSQLLEIVKGLNGWGVRKGENSTFDFYQYLTFKIENGQIVKILP